ncbi:hypothetical protein F0A04_17680 [Salmonella enterica subsp. enterica serovar Typhimurium]|nr:hypothetical protein F0A04_17680 [Salmonella enterica subsp. enterica serovar Typhimurium]
MIKLGQAYNVIRLGKLIPSCSGHNQQNTGVYKSAAEIICLLVFVFFNYYKIYFYSPFFFKTNPHSFSKFQEPEQFISILH